MLKSNHPPAHPRPSTFAGWETVTTISLPVPMGTRACVGLRVPQVLDAAGVHRIM